MSEEIVYRFMLIASFVVAGGVFVALFFIAAPYGRHTRPGWGPPLPNWLAWFLMEAVSPLTLLIAFIIGDAPKNLTAIVFLLMWLAHYVHRAFIYPFMLRDGRKVMPLTVLLLAAFFNLGNAYVNGRYLFHFAGDRYTSAWLLDPRFLTGAGMFVSGFVINRWADAVLRGLRRPGETGYRIPHGGLYRWISCPNYLGEILEWTGWAVATWSLPGLAFAVWTFANLAPRARTNHRWYQATFPDYPPLRRALLPRLW